MPPLTDAAEQERLFDLACARLREGLTRRSAIAAGEARSGLVPVAVAIRDSNGEIDFDLWEVPASGWDPVRFADELENRRLS
jgi:hypothetical protein